MSVNSKKKAYWVGSGGDHILGADCNFLQNIYYNIQSDADHILILHEIMCLNLVQKNMNNKLKNIIIINNTSEILI